MWVFVFFTFTRKLKDWRIQRIDCYFFICLVMFKVPADLSYDSLIGRILCGYDLQVNMYRIIVLQLNDLHVDLNSDSSLLPFPLLGKQKLL